MNQMAEQNIRVFDSLFLNPILTISDIIAIVSLLTVIAGGIFALQKWTWSQKTKRAEFIDILTSRIRTDEAIRDTIYLFDYDKSWYSEEFHSGGHIEKNVDETLSYYSYICYLKEKKLLKKREFDFFEYELERIIHNEQTQDYLFNLYHFSQKIGRPMSFHHLLQYAKKEKLLYKDFFDKDKCLQDGVFHQYLNI